MPARRPGADPVAHDVGDGQRRDQEGDEQERDHEQNRRLMPPPRVGGVGLRRVASNADAEGARQREGPDLDHECPPVDPARGRRTPPASQTTRPSIITAGASATSEQQRDQDQGEHARAACGYPCSHRARRRSRRPRRRTPPSNRGRQPPPGWPPRNRRPRPSRRPGTSAPRPRPRSCCRRSTERPLLPSRLEDRGLHEHRGEDPVPGERRRQRRLAWPAPVASGGR